ncbi:ACT domain-containing protein [Alteromonas sediminis]|uniref:ACT domain-containing protein n=1 Tax=Alteromonas sediminis TaxID=2259342 RepID=A0A3N5Y0J9_9ALTE|nr:ACT domain-containing protein [Alteromonas sediminis]RPJ67207.1 ACT domain-containing protein [Alteromonas sediminis]
MSKQTLAILPQSMVIHSLDADSDIPKAVYDSPLFFIGKTYEELSIVVPNDIEIDSIESDDNWRALELIGPLELSMVGIMAGIGDVLAKAKVSMFVVSTFETDFFLVKDNKLDAAVAALESNGYTVIQH